SSFRRAVGLLARAPPQLRTAHRHACSVDAQVQGGGQGLTTVGFHPALLILGNLRPSASAVRSTCLASTSTPASSCSRSLPSWKLTSAPTAAVMRVTAGESEPPSRPSAPSRGQKPRPQTAQ